MSHSTRSIRLSWLCSYRTMFNTLIALCGLILPSPVVCAGEPVDKSQFVDKLSSAIRRVQGALEYVRVEGDVERLTRRKPIEDTAHGDLKHKIYIRSGDREKIDFYEEAKPDEYFHRLLLVEGRQGYVLRKNKADAHFYLEFPEIPAHFLDGFDNDRKGIIGVIHQFFLIDLASVLKDPKFFIEKVEKLKSDQDGGKIYNRVTFKLTETRELKSGVNTFLVEGNFDVDPENSFAIVAYNARRSRTTANSSPYYSDGEGRVEYSSGTEFPEVKRAVAKMVVSHGQYTRDTLNITSWSYKKTPTSEFDLDYYGLGDFERPVSQSSHGLAFWAFIFVIITLMLGIGLRFLNSRMKDTQR